VILDKNLTKTIDQPDNLFLAMIYTYNGKAVRGLASEWVDWPTG